MYNIVAGLDGLLGDPQPAVAPDGSLYANLPGPMLGALDDNGNLRWHLFEFSNIMSTVDVGPDGTVYDGKNLAQLYAVNSNGTIRWHYDDSGIMYGAVVSPRNDLLMIPGLVTYGQPGFFEAVSTDGSLLWKELLPVENGLNIWPISRARFTPDGQTAYFGMSIAGQGDNPYTYLYSVQTAKVSISLSTMALDPSTVVGGHSSIGTVTLSGPAPQGGTLVRLASTNPIIANVPVSITVPAGMTSVTFTVHTRPVPRTMYATISAWSGSSLKRATLTVTP